MWWGLVVSDEIDFRFRLIVMHILILPIQY
jgi:hypothetical protein